MSSSVGSEANPLGLSLSFIEGIALLSLRDRTVADGLIARALDLEVLDVSFPLDVAGGAEQFKQHATRLRTLVLDLEIAAFARYLQGALLRTSSPAHDLVLRAEEGALAFEAELKLVDHRAILLGQLALAPSEPHGIKLVVSDLVELGYFPLPALGFIEQLRAAIAHLLLPFGDAAARSLRRSGPASIALDVAEALLVALIPPTGWQLPAHEETPLHSVEARADGWIRIALGDLAGVALRADPVGLSPAVLRALAREDALNVAPKALPYLEEGDFRAAFFEMRDRLDASGGPEVLVERLLSIGSSSPGLHTEACDLAVDVLKRSPGSIAALSARARIAAYEGDRANAFSRFEQIARLSRQSGKRRLAGFAFLAASRHAQPGGAERARVLEEAIALMPDDAEALRGLTEELPRLGRAAAAVRAARRLAHLAKADEDRIQAHVTTGDLLRSALDDPVQAKREYERALKVAPEDPRALEGLARAVMAQGDPRRAAELFERLIARAEADGEAERASSLSLVLGDLWRELDPEAALVRYRRAQELEPESIAAALKLAELAFGTGRAEVAARAVEQALPLLEDEETSSKAGPTDVLKLRLLAGAIFEKEPSRVEEAIGQYESALTIDPESPDALIALADLYQKTHRIDRRIEVLGRHAKVLADAGELDGAARLLTEKAKLGRRDDATLGAVEDALTGLLGRDQRHRALLDALVEVAELGDEPEPIIEAIDRRLVIEDPPAVRAELLTRLGDALERAGRTFDAARAYEEALNRDPDRGKAIDSLVAIYRQKDDPERLGDALKRAANAMPPGPDRAQILEEQARLLSSIGRDSEAYEAARGSIDDAPESTELLPLATTLALRLSRFDEARALAERRLERVGADRADDAVRIHVDQALAAEGLGDKEGLVRALRQAFLLADPASDAGRQVAQKLARELYIQDRFVELAELQRARAEIETTPAHERVERFIEAARLALRLGHDQDAEADARKALSVLEAEAESAPEPLHAAVLELLESVARKQGGARPLAEVLERRAAAAKSGKERERIRLDQARLLEEAGLAEDAILVLERAEEELLESIAIAKALGAALERANQTAKAADAYATAARLAEADRQTELAIEMHGKAAEAFAATDPASAIPHDRALLSLCPPGSPSLFAQKAVERLEKHARASSDSLLLVEVLSRKAAVSTPSVAAAHLLEKASLEADVLSSDRSALDSLKRARAVAPDGSDVAEAIDERLIALLGKLELFVEEAAILVDRAERSSDPERQSRYYLEAARVYAGPIADRPMALSRAQAAIRSSPQNEEARALRLRLLREVGRKEALVEALADEAAMSKEAKDAGRLWVEAAQILLPDARAAAERRKEKPNRIDLERGLDLVRRASTASPKAAEPFRAAALYTHLLGRAEEELVCIGQLLEREIAPDERAAVHLERAALLRGPLSDPVASLAELLAAAALFEQLDEDGAQRVKEQILPRTVALFDLSSASSGLLAGVLRAGVTIAEENADHAAVVLLLLRLVELEEDPKARADLRARAGEVIEWRLGDAGAAEREYLAALALYPDHQRSRAALKSFYIGLDRFADLAENLGVDALREVWQAIRGGEAPSRVLAAEALWPLFDPKSAERAEVLLSLGEIYTKKEDRASAVRVLEELMRGGPAEHQDRALKRLGTLFLEEERYEQYADILRKKAERIADDRARAVALAELGDALEWKVGDGQAAEREYRAALALDALCEPARQRLRALLSAQDRFEDMGRDLGLDTLSAELEALLDRGPRDRARAWTAAEALASALAPEARGALWLRFADAVPDEPEERRALECARIEPGPEQAAATERLIARLKAIRARAESDSDSAVLRQALGALAELTKGEERAQHLVQLVDFAVDPAGSGDSVAVEELYKSALAADPSYTQAREGLRVLYEVEGRYRDIAQVLGNDALKETLAQLGRLEDRAALLPAALALAFALEGDPTADRERAGLWAQIGSLNLLDDDPEAAERAFKSAIAIAPDHPVAREELRQLLVAQDRLRDLAEIDEALLIASAQGIDLETKVMRVLADRRSGQARADTLVLLAALEVKRGELGSAEAALTEALQVTPDHALARAELAALFWSSDRFADLARALGPEALIASARRMSAETPARALASLRTLALDTDPRILADALELAATIHDPEAEDEEGRRIRDLEAARGLFDRLADRRGMERTRIAIAHLLRDRGDVESRLVALADASLYALDPSTKAELDLERAGLLLLAEQPSAAKALIEQILAEDGIPRTFKLEGARLLAERIVSGEIEALAPDALELRARALEVLTERGPLEGDVSAADWSRWLVELASAKEAQGLEGEAVAEPLERALSVALPMKEAIALRRRLRAIYEELGDWTRAEAHAALLAEAEASPESWVALAELRTWLDDREGASAALERALVLDPANAAAHEALLRLAERAGATDTVIDRLEAWAEADQEGSRIERAKRMLRAAKVGAEQGDETRAASLAERAAELLGRGDPEAEVLALEACAILEPLGKLDAMSQILARVLGVVPSSARSTSLRLRLDAILTALGRRDEARAVIEQGIHKHTPEDDPLVGRLIEEAGALGDEGAARLLLGIAERVGGGPAARRLRIEGAERAEMAEIHPLAWGAWTAVAAEVGAKDGGARARRALLRLARRIREPASLVGALVDAAEDSRIPVERSGLLQEAAAHAADDLEDLERAETLLRRALAADPASERLQDRLFDLLAKRERWLVLDEELESRAPVAPGSRLASILVRQAENARDRLHDDRRAAELFCRAYQAERSLERGRQAAELALWAGDFSLARDMAAKAEREVARTDAERAGLFLVRAEAEERGGSIDRALEALTEAKRALPASALIEARLIDLLVRHELWRDLGALLDALADEAEPDRAAEYRRAAARILHLRAKDALAAEAVMKRGGLDRTIGIEVKSRPPEEEIAADLGAAEPALAVEIDPLSARLSAYKAEASSRGEARALEEELYRSERWSDLERLLERRLEVEDLTDAERVALVVSRGRILTQRLGRGVEAMEELAEARELMPKSREILSAIADLSAVLGLDDIRQDALARLVGLAETPAFKRSALSERALILERQGELGGAAQCLEEAVDSAAPRHLVERLESIYARRGHWAAAARLWVLVAEGSTGAEAAAALSRAGQIRLDELGDRRGAVAAFEAATRQAPDDLGIRRAVIDLLRSLGDLQKGRMHARAAMEAAERAGESEAWFAFALEEARFLSALSDRTGSLGAWAKLLETRPDHPQLLFELVAKAKESLEVDAVIAVLDRRIASFPAGAVRARHRLAKARLLEDPLQREAEARAERDLVEREDLHSARGEPSRSNGHDPGFWASPRADKRADLEEEYRASRSLLDRTGRWSELATLEERRAEVVDDPLKRSSALVEVGRLYAVQRANQGSGGVEGKAGGSGPENAAAFADKARDAFLRAIKASPDNVDALARLAKLEVDCGEWERAAPVFDRLERLGGPPWAVPSFEILGADVAAEIGKKQVQKARLLRARARDPASIEAIRGLAGIAIDAAERAVRLDWLGEYEAALDPIVSTAELARIGELRAKALVKEGRPIEAAAELERAIDLLPSSESGRALRLELLKAELPPRTIVSMLVDEAKRSGPKEAVALLGRALDLSESIGDRHRANDVARALEALAGDDPRGVTRLRDFFVGSGDGEALLRIADRLGDIEALGSLEPPARAALSRACIGAGRFADAAAALAPLAGTDSLKEALVLALGHRGAGGPSAVQPSPSLESAAMRARVRGFLAKLPDEAWPSDGAVALAEAILGLLPEERSIARHLAKAYHRRPDDALRAAEMQRMLLEEDPLDVDLIRSLEATLLGAGRGEDARGPVMALRILTGAAPEPDLEARMAAIGPIAPIARPVPLHRAKAQLWHPELIGDLGELLRITARAMAEVLPPAVVQAGAAELRPAEEDPRISDLVEEVKGLGIGTGIAWTAMVDLDGGHAVSIEPGVPPTVVLGEALVDDAMPEELRFHLASAAMRIELGCLLAARVSGPRRDELIDLLLLACDPEGGARLPTEDSVVVDHLRATLGPGGLAAAEPVAANLRSASVDLSAWIEAAMRTADRFGLLAAGSLDAAVQGVRRVDLRALGERFGAGAHRLEAVRRSLALTDLVRFVVGTGYAELVRELGA